MSSTASWARGLVLSAAVGSLAVGLAGAQELRTTHVAGNVYMISGAGGNVTVQAGDDGVLVVDTGAVARAEDLLAAIREISTGPIQYILNTDIHPERVGGNAVIRNAGVTYIGGNVAPGGSVDEIHAGAKIIGTESLLHRMSEPGGVDAAPVSARPTDTFYVRRMDLYFNGEPVEMFRQANALNDTNMVVHFRRSDVISTGDIFRLDSYPVIDLERGGSIQGTLAALNFVFELAITEILAEGGTMIIPGRGRVSDRADLVRYRDMLTIIRDRIQALIDDGRTLEEIQQRGVTRDFDGRYGATSGPWTNEMFIEAVYRSLISPPGISAAE